MDDKMVICPLLSIGIFLSNVWPIGAHGMFSMAPTGEG